MTSNYLEHLTVKSTVHVLSTYYLLTREGQIFVCFVLRPAVSEIQIPENRKLLKYTECLQTDFEVLTVKSTFHTITTSTYPRSPNFAPFRSRACHFQDIAHFIVPQWSIMLNIQKKNKKSYKKFQNLKNFTLHNSFNNFGRDCL